MLPKDFKELSAWLGKHHVRSNKLIPYSTKAKLCTVILGECNTHKCVHHRATEDSTWWLQRVAELIAEGRTPDAEFLLHVRDIIEAVD